MKNSMSEIKKLSEKFFEVLQHEGIVSIVSWGIEPHVVNTWNSYLIITADERILIPAYGFRKTEKNVDVNNNVKLTLGSKEVIGFKIIKEPALLLMVRPNISVQAKSMMK